MILPSPLRIEPIAGYSPTIGRLVGMLTYARSTTLAAVEGLTLAGLDHLFDGESNSIGALLAHMATVERSYQVLTFENRLLSMRENELWSTALKLGANGRRALRGYALEHYLEELAAVRQITLDKLGARDDAWLESALVAAPKINAHWAWFHVAEDEINHRGQIRWLRARLPGEFTSTIWPPELDALIAAPSNHRLLLENDRVRVLDTEIQPGKKTPVHTHQWPAVHYVLSWGHFVRRDEAGSVLVDTRATAFAQTPPQVLWGEPLSAHSLENVGETSLHIISVEQKTGPGTN